MSFVYTTGMQVGVNSSLGIVGVHQHFSQTTARVNKTAEQIAKGDVTPGRIVDLMTSEHSFAANATVVRAEDEMVGHLLDVKR